MAKEIKLEFNNYKLLKDRSFDLTEHNVVVFEGGNGRGKSSAITGLEELISVMSFTTQPVTQGQQEGSKRVTWEGVDGKIYTIEHTFDVANGKGKFIAYDDKANPIKSVTKIRELIGQYSRLTVEQFYEMSKVAGGRKKLVDTYFNKLLTPAEQEAIRLAKAYYEEAYEQRTHFGNLMKALKPQITEPTEEEQAILGKEETAKTAEELRSTQLAEFDSLNMRHNQLMDYMSKINLMKEDVSRNLNALKVEWDQGGLETWVDSTVNAMITQAELIVVPDKEDLEVRLANAKRVLQEVATIKGRLGQLDMVKKQYEEAEGSHTIAEGVVKAKTQEIKDVYSNSKLPAGLTIEDDGFSLDGFDLTKEQVSESQVKLAIAEMMCQIDTSGLIVMGNAAVFGQERLDKLCELAEKHNKILFLERVVDEVTDIRAVGVINTGAIYEEAKEKHGETLEKLAKPPVEEEPM